MAAALQVEVLRYAVPAARRGVTGNLRRLGVDAAHHGPSIQDRKHRSGSRRYRSSPQQAEGICQSADARSVVRSIRETASAAEYNMGSAWGARRIAKARTAAGVESPHWEGKSDLVSSPKLRSTDRHETGRARVAGIRARLPGRTLTRLLVAGAAALTVALAVWAMPWVPVGMTRDDYSPRVVIALVLAMGSALTWLAAVFTGGLAGGDRQLAEILNSLLGRRARLRNRHQFHNRLARECRRARRERRSSLSLILVRLSIGEDREGDQVLEHVAHALMATMRSSDVVGIAGDSEIGILAIGADGKAREVIGARVKRALAAALAELSEEKAATSVPEALLGVGSLGSDVTEPGHLLAAARASFAPLAPRARKAA